MSLDKTTEKQTNATKKQTMIIKKRKTNNKKKKIFETDEKCHHKVANTLPLPTEQLKKYVEIDKKIEYQNLVHGKHGLNRYGSLMILYWRTRHYLH